MSLIPHVPCFSRVIVMSNGGAVAAFFGAILVSFALGYFVFPMVPGFQGPQGPAGLMAGSCAKIWLMNHAPTHFSLIQVRLGPPCQTRHKQLPLRPNPVFGSHFLLTSSLTLPLGPLAMYHLSFPLVLQESIIARARLGIYANGVITTPEERFYQTFLP